MSVACLFVFIFLFSHAACLSFCFQQAAPSSSSSMGVATRIATYYYSNIIFIFMLFYDWLIDEIIHTYWCHEWQFIMMKLQDVYTHQLTLQLQCSIAMHIVSIDRYMILPYRYSWQWRCRSMYWWSPNQVKPVHSVQSQPAGIIEYSNERAGLLPEQHSCMQRSKPRSGGDSIDPDHRYRVWPDCGYQESVE